MNLLHYNKCSQGPCHIATWTCWCLNCTSALVTIVRAKVSRHIWTAYAHKSTISYFHSVPAQVQRKTTLLPSKVDHRYIENLPQQCNCYSRVTQQSTHTNTEKSRTKHIHKCWGSQTNPNIASSPFVKHHLMALQKPPSPSCPWLFCIVHPQVATLAGNEQGVSSSPVEVQVLACRQAAALTVTDLPREQRDAQKSVKVDKTTISTCKNVKY